MAKSKYKDHLKKMKTAWTGSKKAYKDQFGGTKVEEAEYEGKLKSAKLAVAKSSGNLHIAREFVIGKGEFKGTTVRDRLWMHTEQGPVYVRRFIDLMGYECPDDPTDIEEVLAAITKEAGDVKFRLAHNGDFTNIRVLQNLEEDEEAEEEDEDAEDAEDEDEDEDEDEEDEDEDEEEEEEEEDDEEEEDEDEDEDEEDEEDEEEEEDEEDEEEEDEDDEEEDDDLKDRAATFCATMGIDIDDDADLDDIKKAIDAGKYEEKELDKEEIDTLKELDLEDCIVKAKKGKGKGKAKGKGKKAAKGKGKGKKAKSGKKKKGKK